MYRDQFGEFVCGYWGLKGLYGLVKKVNEQRNSEQAKDSREREGKSP